MGRQEKDANSLPVRVYYRELVKRALGPDADLNRPLVDRLRKALNESHLKVNAGRLDIESSILAAWHKGKATPSRNHQKIIDGLYPSDPLLSAWLKPSIDTADTALHRHLCAVNAAELSKPKTETWLPIKEKMAQEVLHVINREWGDRATKVGLPKGLYGYDYRSPERALPFMFRLAYHHNLAEQGWLEDWAMDCASAAIAMEARRTCSLQDVDAHDVNEGEAAVECARNLFLKNDPGEGFADCLFLLNDNYPSFLNIRDQPVISDTTSSPASKALVDTLLAAQGSYKAQLKNIGLKVLDVNECITSRHRIGVTFREGKRALETDSHSNARPEARDHVIGIFPLASIAEDDMTCVTKNGDLVQLIELQSKDYSGLSQEHVACMKKARQEFFEALPDDMYSRIISMRYKRDVSSTSHGDSISDEITKAWSRNFWRTRHVIVLSANSYADLRSLVETTMIKLHDYSPRILKHGNPSELMSFWASLLHGRTVTIPNPGTRDMRHILAGVNLQWPEGSEYQIYEGPPRRYSSWLSLKALPPPETTSSTMDRLFRLPYEFTVNRIFRTLSAQQARTAIASKQSLAASCVRMPGLVLEELTTLADRTEAGELKILDHIFSIQVFGDSEDEVDKAVSEVQSTLENRKRSAAA